MWNIEFQCMAALLQWLKVRVRDREVGDCNGKLLFTQEYEDTGWTEMGKIYFWGCTLHLTDESLTEWKWRPFYQNIPQHCARTGLLDVAENKQLTTITITSIKI